MAYVVVATFEFEGAAIMTELIGVYEHQTSAWHALENFDFMKTFNRVMTGNLTPGYVSKEFGCEPNCDVWYSEQHYIDSDKEKSGSVTMWIFEREVE